jgi:ElaB/YqjD/DUF883 family membrane-anchored ribosome-binding protein
MTSSITAQSHKSPETLEHEIDQQRASISSIVDALESKMSPGQLFDQALSYSRGNGSEFFQNLGTTVKNNPVPTVLAGLSLAWLAMNQNRPIAPPRVHTGPSLMDRASAVASKVGQAVDGMKDTLHGAADSVTSKASAAADSVAAHASAAADSVTSHTSALKDKASTWRDGATDRLSDGSERLGRNAEDLTAQAREAGTQVKGQFEYLLKEQPLVLAAVGLALGAAFGAALPVTRHEHRLMGKTSDRLTGQVTAKVQEVKQAVTTEAKAAVEDIRNASTENSGENGTPKAGAQSDDTTASPLAKSGETDLSKGLGTHR